MQGANLLFFGVIYGVGLIVLIVLTMTLRAAGAKAGEGGRATAATLIGALWLWAIAATLYALVAGRSFLWLAPSFIIPITLGLGATFFEPVKRLLRHVSIPALVGVQFYRNAGAVFLIAYFYTDSYLSREFALNAGWGDVLTGMLAAPTALAAYHRAPFWRVAVVAWCFIGIGDLILAPITALTYGGPRPDDFPINAIPIFFGPPLGILLHLIALRALWLQRSEADPGARREV